MYPACHAQHGFMPGARGNKIDLEQGLGNRCRDRCCKSYLDTGHRQVQTLHCQQDLLRHYRKSRRHLCLQFDGKGEDAAAHQCPCRAGQAERLCHSAKNLDRVPPLLGKLVDLLQHFIRGLDHA